MYAAELRGCRHGAELRTREEQLASSDWHLANKTKLVRRTGAKARWDSTDTDLISKYYLPQRGKISVASGETK